LRKALRNGKSPLELTIRIEDFLEESFHFSLQKLNCSRNKHLEATSFFVSSFLKDCCITHPENVREAIKIV